MSQLFFDSLYEKCNGNLDAFFDEIGKIDCEENLRSKTISIETCIFRFVRYNHEMKSVDEMANEILFYGWCDTYENAVKAIRSNLIFDYERKPLPKEPPSLFDNM